MIPILYETGTKNFMTNGIGPLSDAITCVVTNKLNGEYELKMTYPIEGLHFVDIKNDRIILAKNGDISDGKDSHDGKAFQPFFIYKITKPIKGIVTVYGRHISYLASYIISEKFDNSGNESGYQKGIDGLIGAFNASLIKNDNGNPFVISADDDLNGNTEDVYYNDTPKSVRQVIGDGDESIIEKLDYEVEWDKFNIIFHKKIGEDNNVKIAYGKNLKEFEHTESLETLVTGLYPYCSSTSTDDSGETVVNITSLKYPVYAYEKESYIHYKYNKIQNIYTGAYADAHNWNTFNTNYAVYRKTTGKFTKLLAQPVDWESSRLPSDPNHKEYFKKDNFGAYTHVAFNASWDTETDYYSDGFERVLNYPGDADWKANYGQYYYCLKSFYTSAPEFISGKYFERQKEETEANAKYTILEEEPAGFTQSLNAEFYIYEKEDGYIRNVHADSTPAFEKNKYYKAIIDVVKGYTFYSVLTEQPSDWNDDYTNYYTYDGDADSRYDKAYYMRRTTAQDLSNYIGDSPSMELLVYYAREYLNTEKAFKPETVIKINFVDLSKTVEYVNFKNLEHVTLGDTVTILYSNYNIDAKARVMKTEYDTLLEEYSSVELGDITTNVINGIVQMTRKESSSVIKESEKKITDQYKKAVEESFGYLTGAGNGYLILKKSNGYRRLDYLAGAPTFEIGKYYKIESTGTERVYVVLSTQPDNWNDNDSGNYAETNIYGNYKDYYEKTDGNGYDGIIVANAPTEDEMTSCVYINHRGAGFWTGDPGEFALDAAGLNVAITHKGITANSITTGVFDASKATIDNLDVNSLFCGKTDENRRPINDYLTIQNGSIVMGSGNTSIKLVQTYNKIQFLDTNQYVQLGHSETSRPDFGKNLYYDRTSTGHYQLLDTQPNNWNYPDGSPSGNWKNYYRQKELAYISGSKFYVNSMDVLSSIYIGNYAMEGAKLSNDENAGLLIGWTGGV